MFRPLLALTVLFAAPALAWPVEFTHDVEAGQVKFVRVAAVDFLDVEDRSVADVEWMADSGELLLTGKKEGRTQVLLGAGGKVAVWRVRVSQKPQTDAAAWKAAEKACPDFKSTPFDEVKLTVTVQSEACRAALLTFFQTDSFLAGHLRLTYDSVVLQKQLEAMQKRFDAAKLPVEAAYRGAGLTLKGELTGKQHRAALWAVFRESLGRVPLTDDIVDTDAPKPDAGAAEK